jgi:phage shock protein A
MLLGMAEQPENLNTHHLRQFREEILARVDALEQKLDEKIDRLDHKVGNVALTLVGVERDLRRLTNSVGTLGAAVDEIEARLTAIEKRDQHPDA